MDRIVKETCLDLKYNLITNRIIDKHLKKEKIISDRNEYIKYISYIQKLKGRLFHMRQRHNKIKEN
jgi:hypothetical protein